MCVCALVSFESASVDFNYNTCTIHSQSFSHALLFLLAVDSMQIGADELYNASYAFFKHSISENL